MTETAEKAQTKGKGRLKREATEAEIINAFGRVVKRNGLRYVGVNEVIKEAGIGKALLYRYFGGLPGLVKAWGEKNQIWPDSSDLIGLSDGLEEVSAAEQIKRMVLHHANTLRADPVRVEILADEFMSPTPISDALSDIRQQLGQEHHQIFSKNADLQDPDNHMLMVVIMAAASYLAMRAVKSPRYMGGDIGSDEGWDNLMQQFERIVDGAIHVGTSNASTDQT
jgi:AcrR family transcriptional regulator